MFRLKETAGKHKYTLFNTYNSEFPYPSSWVAPTDIATITAGTTVNIQLHVYIYIVIQYSLNYY
jgi:hypothetical protein